MSLRLAMARSKADTSVPSPIDTSRTLQPFRKPSSLKKKKKKASGKYPPMSGHNDKKRKSSTFASESSDVDSDRNGADDTSEGEDGADEADEPASFAPSYGPKKRRSNHKPGLGKSRMMLTTKKNKKRKFDHGDSGAESDFGDNASVSSVSSVDATMKSDDSDDGYEGVDDVSDGEDEDVEKQEEALILNSEYGHGFEPHISNDWMGLDEIENRPLYSAGSFFDEGQLLLHAEDYEVLVEAEVAVDTTPVPRRVHFEPSENSDSDSSTDDDFPDFLQQDSLDPDLRRMIENDYEPPSRPRSPHDFYISSDLYEIPGNIYHVESDTAVESSSEYESKHRCSIVTMCLLLT